MLEFIKNIKIETIINILTAMMIVGIFYLFSYAFSYIMIKIVNPKKKKVQIQKNIFYRPIQIFFTILGIYIGAIVLKLPVEMMTIVTKIFKIVIICLAANAFANIVNSKSTFSSKLQEKLGFNGDNTVANFVGKIIKTVIYVIAGFLVISELGYDLNGLVAGLGLGGVVVALAAQDIAKNLFGGVAILFDKPFVVGDWIEAGSYTGAVEDITFRSTKIRTADDSVVTVPNSILSNESIINWNRLNKRRYAFNLPFERATSIEKIQEISDKIEFILENNPNLEKETVEVHIDRITEYAVNIFISVYTPVIPYYDYLAVKETVNCSIMELLEKENVELAYPTQNINKK